MTTTLAPGLALRHLDAPHFLATKFEAFNNRGGRDVYASHDLEDIITVIDGRAELADELAQTTPSVRTHVVPWPPRITPLGSTGHLPWTPAPPPTACASTRSAMR